MVVVAQHEGQVDALAHDGQQLAPEQLHQEPAQVEQPHRRQQDGEHFHGFLAVRQAGHTAQHVIDEVLEEEGARQADGGDAQGQESDDPHQALLAADHPQEAAQAPLPLVLPLELFRGTEGDDLSQVARGELRPGELPPAQVRVTEVDLLPFHGGEDHIVLIDAAVEDAGHEGGGELALVYGLEQLLRRAFQGVRRQAVLSGALQDAVHGGALLVHLDGLPQFRHGQLASEVLEHHGQAGRTAVFFVMLFDQVNVLHDTLLSGWGKPPGRCVLFYHRPLFGFV